MSLSWLHSATSRPVNSAAPQYKLTSIHLPRPRIEYREPSAENVHVNRRRTDADGRPKPCTFLWTIARCKALACPSIRSQREARVICSRRRDILRDHLQLESGDCSLSGIITWGGERDASQIDFSKCEIETGRTKPHHVFAWIPS